MLADGPNWRQEQINNNAPIPDVFQWVRGGGGNQIFMLNADIAIVRDLSGGFIEADGEANCQFRFPQASRCPLADTLTKAGIYRSNNFEWLTDFKSAMTIMLEKGM